MSIAQLFTVVQVYLCKQTPALLLSTRSANRSDVVGLVQDDTLKLGLEPAAHQACHRAA